MSKSRAGAYYCRKVYKNRPHARRIYLFWVAALFFLLPACSVTRLEPPVRLAALETLAGINRRPLHFRVEPSGLEQTSAGRQFALLVVPIGSIQLGSPDAWVDRLLFERLSLLGFGPRPGCIDFPAPCLSVRLKKFSLNAYDLLITRLVRCDVTVESMYRGRRNDAVVSRRDFMLFPFAAPLKRASARAIRAALDKALLETVTSAHE